MLVEFTVDPEAIKIPAPADDEENMEQAEQALDALVELWERFGVLIYGDPVSSPNHLSGAIEGLPMWLRRRWQEAIRRNRVEPQAGSWDGPAAIGRIADVDRVCSAMPSLDCLLLDGVRATLLGLQPRQYSQMSPSGSYEIAKYRSSRRAQSFDDCLALSRTRVEVGEDPNQIWSSRFEGFARHARNVVIVDGYAYIELLENRNNQSGLERFLRKLARVSPGCNLEVYSAFIDRNTSRGPSFTSGDYRTRLQELIHQISNGRIRTGAFFMCERRDFRPEAHARHIRFDRTVLYPDTGVKLLHNRPVDQACRLPVEVAGNTEQRVEALLRRSAYPNPERW